MYAIKHAFEWRFHVCLAPAPCRYGRLGPSPRSACSSGDDDSGGAGGGEDNSFTVGFSTYAGVIPYYQSTLAGFQDAADEYGWELLYADSNFDANKQVSQISNFITQGVDLILVSPGDEEALIQSYREANDAQIPVWSFVNDVAESGQDLRPTWLGVEWDVVAEERAQFMIDEMGGCGDVVAIRGPSPVQIVRLYEEGFDRVMAENSCVNVVYAQNAPGFTPDEGLRLGSGCADRPPQARAIWIDNDDLAIGVTQAVEEAGLAPEDVVIVSGDGNNAGITMVAEGQLDYTMVAPGYEHATTVMEIARAFLEEGTEPEPNTLLETFGATQEDAAGLLESCPETPKEVYCLGG